MRKSVSILAILASLFIGVFLTQNVDARVAASVNIVLAGPPMFVFPPALGFYVAVGVPYDMFFVDMRYYLCMHGAWYVAPYYDGPWVVIRYRRLPRILRMHKYQQIVKIRDQEYRVYQGGPDHYRGKQYRPDRHQVPEGNRQGDRGGKSQRGRGGR
jgi:hypothetical protein